MTTNTFKTLALVGAIALGMIFTPGSAKAQTTVNNAIITNAAITVTDGLDGDWGTWFLAVVAADDFTLTMDTAGAIVAAGNVTSFATETISVDQEATVLVQVPAAGIELQMIRSVITDMPDAGLTFQNTTYGTVTEGADQPLNAIAVPVTVVAAGVNETVSFGGQINVTATPANATHTAVYTVSFSY